MGKFIGIESLSKISYFDLIYYNEKVDDIFDERCEIQGLYNKARKGLLKGISDFFGNQIDGRSAINNITIGNEGLINETFSYLKNDKVTSAFAQINNIDFYNKKFDRVGCIQRFFQKYIQVADNQDENIVVLRTLPSLMSTLRAYRNLTAHSSMNTHEFTADEVRIAMNMMLEAFRCAKQNPDLWKRIKMSKGK